MSDRLTQSEWLDHGLALLAQEGPGALKVGAMAAGLGVSRGSFYWHFRNIGEFEALLLEKWQAISTDQIIDELDARPGDPDRLKNLLRLAFIGHRRLDHAVRTWATQDSKVAAIVAAVDDRRIARLARLLTDAGIDGTSAAHRAVFLYWAFLGRAAAIDPRHASLPDQALNEIAALLQRPAP